MNNIMRSVVQIWMQPIYHYKNNKDDKLFYFLLLILPLACISISVMKYGVDVQSIAIAVVIGIGASIAVFCLAWPIVLVTLIRSQFSPENAQLIPDYRRHLKIAIIIPMLVLAIIFIVITSQLQHRSIGFAWILSILFMLGATSIIRTNYFSFVFPSLLILSSVTPKTAFSTALVKAIALIDHYWITIPCGFLILWAGLQWIFSIEKDQLYDRKKHFDQLKKQIENNTSSDDMGYFRKISLYDRAFAHATKGDLPVRQVLPFLYGPKLHWSQYATMYFFMPILIYVYTAIFISTDYFFIGLVFGSYLIFISYALSTISGLYKKKQEQSLVLLSPMISSDREMTHLTLRYFLRNNCVVWSISFAFTLLVCQSTDVEPALMKMAYLVCFGCLPFISCLTKNHALNAHWNDKRIISTFFISGLFIGISLTLLYLFQDLNILIPCAVMFVSQLLLVHHQWNKRVQQAALFPSGRAE